jgi:hypothetical protein
MRFDQPNRAVKLLTKAAPAAAKARARRTDEARAMGRSAVAPVIRELQAAGVTSLGGIARALNEHGIPTGVGHLAGLAGQPYVGAAVAPRKAERQSVRSSRICGSPFIRSSR